MSRAHGAQRIFLIGAGFIGIFISWKAFYTERSDPIKHKEKRMDVLSPSSSVSPLDVFNSWMIEYEMLSNSKITSKFAALSTIKSDENGNLMPSARMISVLDITNDFTFMFGTILSSNKVQEMSKNNNICLTFNYNESRTSIRVNGVVKQCDKEISKKYWKSRGKSYKIWSMTTTQNKEIESIDEFEKRINETTEKYKNMKKEDIDLPVDKWAVFEIIPFEIEFWRYGSRNLHLRHRYIKNKNGWKCIMLDS